MTNYKDLLKELQEANDELTKYGSIMDGYNKAKIQESIKAKRDQYYSLIVNGVLQEYEGKIDSFRKARSKVNAAKQKELSSWEVDSLTKSITLIRQLVELERERGDTGFKDPKISERLQGIYEQAKNSGRIQHRAACEVMQSLNNFIQSTDQEERIKLNGISQQAKDDLEELRIAPEIIEAEKEEHDKYLEMIRFQGEIKAVGKAVNGQEPSPIFAHDSLGQALRRIRRGQDGTVYIFEKDSPEVTGVHMGETENKIYGDNSIGESLQQANEQLQEGR